MTVGGYNYSVSESDRPRASLSIPNVPLDAGAFSETALVYSALIGRAPTNAEVAKITLTPQYEVRCLSKRVNLIMELPEYGARYGLAMPDVDFVNVENGRSYTTGAGDTILVEAVSMGPDNLAGTVDDGSVRAVEVFLNGISQGNLNFGTFYYEFTVPTTLPSGEYKLEVVAEDANGLKSRSERDIVVRSTTDPVVSLTSPVTGTVLQLEAKHLLDFPLMKMFLHILRSTEKFIGKATPHLTVRIYRQMNPLLAFPMEPVGVR